MVNKIDLAGGDGKKLRKHIKEIDTTTDTETSSDSSESSSSTTSSEDETEDEDSSLSTSEESSNSTATSTESSISESDAPAISNLPKKTINELGKEIKVKLLKKPDLTLLPRIPALQKRQRIPLIRKGKSNVTNGKLPVGRVNNKKEESSHKKQEIVRKRIRKERQIKICLSNCRYEVVRKISQEMNLKEAQDYEDWNIYWTDFSISLERAMEVRRHQVVNHFPGMSEICRKDLLSRNLNRMKRLFPTDYDIFPKTWSLPADLGDLQNYAQIHKNSTFICKPETGCQGKGIFLIRGVKQLNSCSKIICQLYLAKPFLIDGLKFDLRIYVLVTSCDPLRIYVYKEGLGRFATAKYKSPAHNNLENSYLHLTNYAINKFSGDYIVDEKTGTKRKLSLVYKWMDDNDYDSSKLIADIDDIIIKTILAAHPIIKHSYLSSFKNHDNGGTSAAFEVLGFDIIIDSKLKPYLLEVNHSPSFHTDTRLDKDLKEGLLKDTFAMLNLKMLDRHKLLNEERKRILERLTQNIKRETQEAKDSKINNSDELTNPTDIQFAHEVANCGEYRLIYPSQNSEKYDIFFEQNSVSLYQETAASQARAQCTRTHIKQYNEKKLRDESKRMDKPKGLTKNKLAPESPGDPSSLDDQSASAGIKRKEATKQLQKRDFTKTNFAPTPIRADDEFERLNSMMRRGMLLRSLGVEAQVFRLLCHNGTIKPGEKTAYNRMYGKDRDEGEFRYHDHELPMMDLARNEAVFQRKISPNYYESNVYDDEDYD